MQWSWTMGSHNPLVLDAGGEQALGMPLHKDNQSIIKERIFLDKANADLLHDEITIIDHALTRPWSPNQYQP